MIAELLPELIIEILNRVPVRDRAKFRCVCKSWSTLISHLFLKRIPNFLVFESDTKYDRATTFSSYDMKGNLLKQFEKNNFSHYMRLVSTCLDFVCMATRFYRTAYLCNPTTEDLMTVPLGGTLKDALGFGYAASTKEFKLLRICDLSNCCELFTVETNYGWRAVQSAPFSVRPYEHGAFANGCIHFLPGARLINGDIHEIAFFNVEQEEWGRVALPPIYCAVDKIVLRELGGCLSVVVLDGNYGERSLEIWLLKNLEWVKEYCFNIPPALDMVWVFYLPNYVGPLFEDDDGSLLLVLAPKPNPTGAIYRVKCNSNKVVDCQVLARGRDLSTSLYLESYISFQRLHDSRKRKIDASMPPSTSSSTSISNSSKVERLI